MFRVSLDQMEKRQIEIAEFTEKLNRLRVRLEAQAKTLETMESFSEIADWLWQTEERMSEQAAQAGQMGAALESVIRFYRNSEERILAYLENGPAEQGDEAVAYVTPQLPGDWPEHMEF